MKNGKFYYTDNTDQLIADLKRVKEALQTVAGRPTPTSLMLGKAISHIALLDAQIYHMTEEAKNAPKPLKDAVRQFMNTAEKLGV